MRALSIQQPNAEQILRGTKKIEHRSLPTRILNERVYIYASLTPGKLSDFEAMHLKPGDLPTGRLVGTVEIAKCTGKPGDYQWRLVRPKRLIRKLRPRKRPQPVWFNPF
jgi:predicted transcriptional regulator